MAHCRSLKDSWGRDSWIKRLDHSACSLLFAQESTQQSLNHSRMPVLLGHCALMPSSGMLLVPPAAPKPFHDAPSCRNYPVTQAFPQNKPPTLFSPGSVNPGQPHARPHGHTVVTLRQGTVWLLTAVTLQHITDYPLYISLGFRDICGMMLTCKRTEIIFLLQTETSCA